jgi:hypothetical protein
MKCRKALCVPLRCSRACHFHSTQTTLFGAPSKLSLAFAILALQHNRPLTAILYTPRRVRIACQPLLAQLFDQRILHHATLKPRAGVWTLPLTDKVTPFAVLFVPSAALVRVIYKATVTRVDCFSRNSSYLTCRSCSLCHRLAQSLPGSSCKLRDPLNRTTRRRCRLCARRRRSLCNRSGNKPSNCLSAGTHAAHKSILFNCKGPAWVISKHTRIAPPANFLSSLFKRASNLRKLNKMSTSPLRRHFT